jgi:CcmD family protein
MRPLTLLRAAAVAALLSLSPLPAAAQEGAAPVSAPAADAPASPETAPAGYDAASAAAQPSGLPARPQTLRPYWHVFIAFTLAWLLLFGYVVTLARKLGRIERDLQTAGG